MVDPVDVLQRAELLRGTFGLTTFEFNDLCMDAFELLAEVDYPDAVSDDLTLAMFSHKLQVTSGDRAA